MLCSPPPLGGIIFGGICGATSLPSATGRCGPGIPTALEGADGDLVAHVEIWLNKFALLMLTLLQPSTFLHVP